MINVIFGCTGNDQDMFNIGFTMYLLNIKDNLYNIDTIHMPFALLAIVVFQDQEHRSVTKLFS